MNILQNQTPVSGKTTAWVRSLFAAVASLVTVAAPSSAIAQKLSPSSEPKPSFSYTSIANAADDFSLSVPVVPAKPTYVVKIGQGDDSFPRYIDPKYKGDGGGYTGSAFLHFGRRSADGSGWVVSYDAVFNTPQQYATASYGRVDPIPYSGTQIGSVSYDSGPGPNAFGVGGFAGVSGDNGLGAIQDGYHGLFGIKKPDWAQNPGPFKFVGGVNGWASKELAGVDTPIGGHVALTSDAQAALGLNDIQSRADLDFAWTLDKTKRLPRAEGLVGTAPDPLAEGVGMRLGPLVEYNPYDPAYQGGAYGNSINPIPLRWGVGASTQVQLGSFFVGAQLDCLSAGSQDPEKPTRGALPSLMDKRATLSVGFKW